MSISKAIRGLAIASTFALAIMSAPTFQGLANAASTCGTSAGTCTGSLKCSADGKSFNYSGGDILQVKGVDGRTRSYICDGTTGHWVQLRTQTEMGPMAPLPTTMAP